MINVLISKDKNNMSFLKNHYISFYNFYYLLRKHKNIFTIFRDFRVPVKEKLKILELIIQSLNACGVIKKLMYILYEKNIIYFFDEVIINFLLESENILNLKYGLMFAKKPFSNTSISRLESFFKKNFKKNIKIIFQLNENIKDGFIIRFLNKSYNYTLIEQKSKLYNYLIKKI